MSNNAVGEFIIRTEKSDKKYQMMRFGQSLNLKVAEFKNVKMARENNEKVMKFEDDMPKFGAGSEYGREQKTEARRKMYGIRSKKYNPEDQPWHLKIGKGKDYKRFKGTRDGGVSENASYYVFFQAADGAFEAFPVSEWYNFVPIKRYKSLSAEEAEEQFEKRHKILNHFAVMYQKKKGDGEQGPEEDVKIKGGRRGKDFKVSDMDAWDNDSDADRSFGEDDDEKPSKKSLSKKKKKKADSDAESEGKEESDEGDFDDKELDYISDTSSDEEEEDKEKDGDELKGVEDEDALRKLFLSDDEDEDEEQENGDDKDDADKDASKTGSSKMDFKKEKNSDSSASDDSDLDESKISSSIFMQQRKAALKGKLDSASSSRAATPTVDMTDGPSGLKRKEMSDSPSTSASGAKKPRTAPGTPEIQNPKRPSISEEGISEETVRRYLMRKPMTTTELLQKFKKLKEDKKELVPLIGNILKKLNPNKRQINGKMYLSMK